MQTEPITEPTRSRFPEPIRRRNQASSVLAKLLGVLRGDKYMAGAYPPDWHGAVSAPDAEGTNGR
jgi:hypothetical protein